MKRLIYQQITRQVIQNLSSAGSWQKLWQTPRPLSLNGHRYRGINHLLLSASEYSSLIWGTFNQIRQNGGKVKKGEKSRMVVFWKKSVKTTEDEFTGKPIEAVKYMLRYYLVFNTDQCAFDDLGKEKINGLSKGSQGLFKQRLKTAEEIIRCMPDRPVISIGMHETPCYVPALDEIRMPDIKYFYHSDAYYAAFFHELVHCTGSEKRLSRFTADQFDPRHEYSKEELVAELGAAYLLAVAGIKSDLSNTTAYIKSWLKALNDNPRWIIWAASKAEKACEYIMPSKVNEQVKSLQI